jgi:hypothetical protein
MNRIDVSADLMAALEPFLSEARPLEAAERAGVELPPDLADGEWEKRATSPFPADLVAALAVNHGPPPPLRVSVQARAASSIVAGGYLLAASTRLSVLDQVLSELWRVETIPRELSESVVFLRFDELQTNCNNVPADGTVGAPQLPSPPTVSASSVRPTNVHVDVVFRLPVLVSGEEAAALSGVLGLEVPLDFDVRQDFVQLTEFAIEGVTGSLTIDGTSTITPQSEAARGALEGLLVPRARGVFAVLAATTLRFPAAMPIQKKRYPNSFLRIVQAGAVTVRADGRDFAKVGINVQNRHLVNPSGLTAVGLPRRGSNLHAIVDEKFASDALSSIIASGDLAAFINRVLARHSPVSLRKVVVDGGRVSFGSGRLHVSLDCTMKKACEFGKDLGFTASVTGTAGIANGTLTLESSDVDINLDNSDAFLCTILNSILGPLGTVATIAVEAYAASLNPSSSDLDIPVSETSTPLPGSDKVVHLELTHAAIGSGALGADGQLSLIADPEHVFAYLRVVEKLGPVIRVPVAGATVQLHELDNPPPSGDDVVVPKTGETDVFRGNIETTTTIQYDRQPDQLLGTERTDENGEVTFVATSNKIGGMKTKTTTQTDVPTERVTSSRTERIPIPEPGPDLAVTITSATGQVLAQRRLIGLNVATRRLGTFDRRVEVAVTPRPGTNE